MRKKHETNPGEGNVHYLGNVRESKTEAREKGETFIVPNCVIDHETERAWKIRPNTWVPADAVWVPKSVTRLHTHVGDKSVFAATSGPDSEAGSRARQ